MLPMTRLLKGSPHSLQWNSRTSIRGFRAHHCSDTCRAIARKKAYTRKNRLRAELRRAEWPQKRCPTCGSAVAARGEAPDFIAHDSAVRKLTTRDGLPWKPLHRL